MTIRHKYCHVDLISYSSFYISSNICFLKKLHNFLHNSFPVVLLCHPGYCISFCCPFIRQSCRQCFIVILFSTCCIFVCWLFLDIKCPWISLVCSIYMLFSNININSKYKFKYFLKTKISIQFKFQNSHFIGNKLFYSNI